MRSSNTVLFLGGAFFGVVYALLIWNML